MIIEFCLLRICWTYTHVRKLEGFQPRGRPTYILRIKSMIAAMTQLGRCRRARLCSSPVSLMPY